MNEEDLVSHLGTIARSGTKNFLSQLSGDAKKDSNLIGQFGVGFYSAFMVADKVEVVSRKAGEDKAWRWTSDGKTGFEIEPAEREVAGTTVLLHFNDEGAQYANSWRLQEIVKKYSNHIAFPIFLTYDKSEWNAEEKKSTKVRTTEQVNAASALWRRPKSELKDEDYKELYKSVAGDWEDPLFWFHTKAEGSLEYTTLFYIPAKAPLDLYQSDYKGGVKLYVKRVFIMDDAKELLPQYLRFVRGIIDSEDLAPQREPRNPAAEPRPHQHPHRQRQEDPLRAEVHRDRPARGVPQLHHRVQPASERRPLQRLSPIAKRSSTWSALSPPRSKASPASPTSSRA